MNSLILQNKKIDPSTCIVLRLGEHEKFIAHLTQRLPLLDDDILRDGELQKDYRDSITVGGKPPRIVTFSYRFPDDNEILKIRCQNHYPFSGWSGKADDPLSTLHTTFVTAKSTLDYLKSFFNDKNDFTPVFYDSLSSMPSTRIFDFACFLHGRNSKFNPMELMTLLGNDGGIDLTISPVCDDYWIYQAIERLHHNFDESLPLAWQWELARNGSTP